MMAPLAFHAERLLRVTDCWFPEELAPIPPQRRACDSVFPPLHGRSTCRAARPPPSSTETAGGTHPTGLAASALRTGWRQGFHGIGYLIVDSLIMLPERTDRDPDN